MITKAKTIQNFTVKAGNKLTAYALKGDLNMIVCSEAEPYVSQSAIARGSRPKDNQLAAVNYGKMVSSPMGNNICATVRLPKELASREEFHRQMDMLYDQAMITTSVIAAVTPNRNADE